MLPDLGPEMTPEEIVALGQEFADHSAELAGLTAIMMASDAAPALLAALIMVFEDVSRGECKDCHCTACDTMRGIINGMMPIMHDLDDAHGD